MYNISGYIWRNFYILFDNYVWKYLSTYKSEYLNIIHTLDFVPRVLHCLGTGQEVGDGAVGGTGTTESYSFYFLEEQLFSIFENVMI